MQQAEAHDIEFLIDMRDEMFSPDGSDVFQWDDGYLHPSVHARTTPEALEVLI